MDLGARCRIVPPYLLEQLARTGVLPEAVVEETLRLDAALRERRARRVPVAERVTTDQEERVAWRVHDAQQGTQLPGLPVRSEGDGATGDVAVDEAADGIVRTLSVFAESFGRDSYDGQGAMVSLTVHYGRRYANAFWDGTQLVFGDGDQTVFSRFTAAIDVLGHEFAHAVTERTTGLVYQGQSGALNESMSDVFGSIVRQEALGQDAAAADWLIGQGIFVEGINARALRDMAEPGTAYDDPQLGKDPQPAHMDDYIETTDDNGGVHLNSGIPNRAFVLAARAIGGTSAAGAGQVWYSTLTSGDVAPDADFARFAQVTIEQAGEHAEAVRAAWQEVGVLGSAGEPRGSTPGSPTPAPDGPPTDPVPADPTPADPTPADPTPAETVAVRRSGGFAGRVTEAEVDLWGDDPRAPVLRDLLDRRPLAAARSGHPHPDGFVYTFRTAEGEVTVPEQNLTADLAAMADLLLREDPSI